MPVETLLLTDPSPCLRYLVLTKLLGREPSDLEVRQLARERINDPLTSDLLHLQEEDGSWKSADPHSPDAANRVISTSRALTRFGYLGFDEKFPAVRQGAEYLFKMQETDGSWKLADQWKSGEQRERYTMIPLQTALPLRGLAACGYAAEPRAEKAYEWLLARRLEDGAWPTGIASDVYGFVAGYRRLPHSRWGCRSNTTAVLACLSLHPGRREGEAAQKALDLLLARETREQYTLGFEVSRIVGLEPWSGFVTVYARFDPALLLKFCGQIGADRDDERVAALINFVEQLKGPYGLWEYQRVPQATRWVTFDILRSLQYIRESGNWIGRQPRTPFQAYPRRIRRY